ncbi:MAG TPA: molybdenum cofactor guanylyltransferase [Candidatus Micrarchaeaceae archaeon]|nr:molybdenum cofactor guanylyltransferase [Candidatus Micrarchaeaceae archaeon]
MLGLLILAGGASSRMGTDKPGVPFPDPGDPALIRWVAAAVAKVAGPPTIAGSRDYGTGWPLVPDEAGLSGPVAGLVAGLEASVSDLVLVLASDLPFASPRVAQGLAELAERELAPQAFVPERRDQLEPLFAVYRRSAAAELRSRARQLAQPGHGASVHQTVAGIRLRRVTESEWRVWDPEGLSFLNCNTPAELAKAAERARARQVQGGTR